MKIKKERSQHPEKILEFKKKGGVRIVIVILRQEDASTCFSWVKDFCGRAFVGSLGA